MVGRAKEAIKLVRRKLQGTDSKTLKLSLILLEQLMDKCGNPVHIQVGTRDFMNALILILHNGEVEEEVSEAMI
jgi:hypothetical protein